MIKVLEKVIRTENSLGRRNVVITQSCHVEKGEHLLLESVYF